MEIMNRFRFIEEWKKYGLKVAIYNLKFVLAYRWLGATSMKVTTRKQK